MECHVISNSSRSSKSKLNRSFNVSPINVQRESLDSTLIRYLQSLSPAASAKSPAMDSPHYRHMLPSIENFNTPPPALFRTPVKVEEDDVVVVMDGILVSSGKSRAASNSGGKTRSSMTSSVSGGGSSSKGSNSFFKSGRGKEELHPSRFPNKEKSEAQICKFTSSGACSYGSNCNFVHHQAWKSEFPKDSRVLAHAKGPKPLFTDPENSSNSNSPYCFPYQNKPEAQTCKSYSSSGSGSYDAASNCIHHQTSKSEFPTDFWAMSKPKTNVLLREPGNSNHSNSPSQFLNQNKSEAPSKSYTSSGSGSYGGMSEVVYHQQSKSESPIDARAMAQQFILMEMLMEPKNSSDSKSPYHLFTQKISEAQTCKAYTSPGSCSHGAKCQFFNYDTPKSKSSTESRALSKPKAPKMLIMELESPSSSSGSKVTLSSSDWSPLDDGIEVALPPSASTEKIPSREAVNAYIQSVLYGPSQGKRLPICEEICFFAEICAE